MVRACTFLDMEPKWHLACKFFVPNLLGKVKDDVDMVVITFSYLAIILYT